MMHFKYFLFLSLFLSSFLSQGSDLSCSYLYDIQNQFLENHILHSSLKNSLKKRVLKQFIKDLDREKIYFLHSDVRSIYNHKSRSLFKKVKSKDCSDLYAIYDLYAKRVTEQINFAEKYLSTFTEKDFNKNLTYVLDDDLKKHPSSKQEARHRMKVYMQYQIANIFLVEENLKKSIQHISIILKNVKKQVQSWKPKLTRKELKVCHEKSRDSFKFCKPTKWLSHYLNAFAQSLDSHSSYLDNEEIEDFKISMNLSLEGIGANLRSRFGYTTVERIVPGGAAYKSKQLKKKDTILAVGQSKKKMIDIFGERIDDVVSIIRGKKGTPVYLKVLREENKKKKTLVVKIIRDTVDLKEEAASISYIKKKIDGKPYKVAVIKVPSFYGSGRYNSKSVTRDVKKLIGKANKKQISAMVLDLSNNRGGSLSEAVDLAGLFFASGNVVKQSEKDRRNPSVALKDNDGSVYYSKPLVVLVNRLSASASEIVSGTLQDYKRAIVVGGDHTFGKGSVQTVEYLRQRLGALKTTVGLYFIPSGKSTQKQGIVSDISLPSIFNIEELGEKKFEYALPEQKIRSFKSSSKEIFSDNPNENWNPVTKNIIRTLKKNSLKRVNQSKDFKKIIKDFNEIKEKSKNQKLITIGEVLNEKKDPDKKDDFNLDDLLDPKKSKEKYLKRADVQESAHIAAHLASLFYKQKMSQSQKNP